MKNLLRVLAALLCVSLSIPVAAQSVRVVTACGSALATPFDVGFSPNVLLIDVNGNLCNAPLTQGYKAAVTVTRPANATAYTANDVLGATAAAITFPSVGPAAGGEVLITTVKLEIDVAAIPSGMTSFRLYLYSVTPPSALADNAAWDLPSGDRASFKGYVDIGTPVDLGSTLYVETLQVNKQITVPSGGSLFGYLVTNGGFTPAGNSEVYVVTLHSVGM